MFPQAFKGGGFPPPCLAYPTSITLDCFGNIYPCWPYLELGKSFLHLDRHKLLNRRENQIKKLWYSPSYEKIKKTVSSCRACFWNCHSELSILYK